MCVQIYTKYNKLGERTILMRRFQLLYTKNKDKIVIVKESNSYCMQHLLIVRLENKALLQNINNSETGGTLRSLRLHITQGLLGLPKCDV